MTRTLFRGATVVDGSGADPAPADIVISDGRIVDIGPGLDGDEAIDLDGKAVLPGLFDCHTHVIVSSIDTMRLLQTPFSYRFFQAAKNLGVDESVMWGEYFFVEALTKAVMGVVTEW